MDTPAYTKLSTAELHMLALNADAEAKAAQNSYDRNQYERFRQAIDAAMDCDCCPLQETCSAVPPEKADELSCKEALFIYVLTGEKPS